MQRHLDIVRSSINIGCIFAKASDAFEFARAAANKNALVDTIVNAVRVVTFALRHVLGQVVVGTGGELRNHIVIMILGELGLNLSRLFLTFQKCDRFDSNVRPVLRFIQ